MWKKHASNNSPNSVLSKSYDSEHISDLIKKNPNVFKVPTILSLKNKLAHNAQIQPIPMETPIDKDSVIIQRIKTPKELKNPNLSREKPRFFKGNRQPKLHCQQHESDKSLSFEMHKELIKTPLLTDQAPKTTATCQLREVKMPTFSKFPKEDTSPLIHQRKASFSEKSITTRKDRRLKKVEETTNQTSPKYFLGDDINEDEEHHISKEFECSLKLETLENESKCKEENNSESQEKTITGISPNNRKSTNSIHKKTLSISYTPNILKTEARLFDKNRSQKVFYNDQSRFLLDPRKSTLSLRYSFKTARGYSSTNLLKPNQDSFIANPNFGKNINQHLFSICDGHGPEGHLVSQFIKEELPKTLLNDKEQINCLTNALFRTVKETQSLLITSHINIEFSGSTLILAHIHDEKLTVLNVGDSRAVLGRKNLLKKTWESSALSIDHKPESPEEKTRILYAGGRIEKFKDAQGREYGPTRVWFSQENTYGISMSRSLGDGMAKRFGVTWEPDIKEFDLDEDMKFIVLGSDGLWEVIENNEV